MRMKTSLSSHLKNKHHSCMPLCIRSRTHLHVILLYMISRLNRVDIIDRDARVDVIKILDEWRVSNPNSPTPMEQKVINVVENASKIS